MLRVDPGAAAAVGRAELEGGQQVRQPFGGQRLDHADAQPRPGPGDLAAQPLVEVQPLAGERREALAGRGGRGAGAGPAQHRDAELLLEAAQLIADAGLGEAEPLGGRGDPAALEYREKGA